MTTDHRQGLKGSLLGRRVLLAAVIGCVAVVGLFVLARAAITAVEGLFAVHTSEGTCWRFGEHSCWGLSSEFISRASGVALPRETVVVSSSTSAWLSWNLTAHVELPKGERLPASDYGPSSVVRNIGRSADGSQIIQIAVSEDGGEEWPVPK